MINLCSAVCFLPQGRNIIHGSDGEKSAAHEINTWFADNEIANWNPTISSWLYE